MYPYELALIQVSISVHFRTSFDLNIEPNIDSKKYQG
jgi:hypothetical protein